MGPPKGAASPKNSRERYPKIGRREHIKEISIFGRFPMCPKDLPFTIALRVMGSGTASGSSRSLSSGAA